MKTRIRILSLLLALLLLFSTFWGCAASSRTDGSTVTDSNLTGETTQDPSPAEDSELHVDASGRVLSDTVLQETGFTLWQESSHVYRYTGTASTITFPETNITLTLPEDWLNQVTVSWYQDGSEPTDPWHGYITSNAILQAQFYAQFPEWEGEDIPIDELSAFDDCLLEIVALPKNGAYDTPNHNTDYRTYLGEDETFCYYLDVLEFQEEVHRNEELVRFHLIEQIGEDAYWDLVADLLLTPEQALQMVSSNEPTQ